MKDITSFSDYFLLKAASQYVYEISFFHVYKDPYLTVQMNLKHDFLNRYRVELYENEAFEREGTFINLRYILFKDVKTEEYALVFQGSEGSMTDMFSGEDTDWSNNLNSAAHLPLENYELAKKEFEYLRKEKGYKITALSGNSLGGGYALYIADFYEDVRAIGLNAAVREFSERYKPNPHATLVLTSSDLLSRGMSLDISRLEGEQTVEYQINKSTEERIEEAYGIKPYMIQRSIPYTSGENISIGHLGAMRNYRNILIKIYKENALFYNANIITKHKEWRSFSKFLLLKTFRELAQEDYRTFTENYIYPALTDNDKGIVNTAMYYPQLEDFTSFDLKSMNLIDKHGIPLKEVDYVIKDSFSFINNLNKQMEGYRKSKSFLINNSIYELKSVFDNAGLTFSKKTFIAPALKLSIDWDWMFAKMFIDMPLSVKFKTGEFVEQNISFVYNLNARLTQGYKLAEEYNETQINHYVNELIEAMFRFRRMNKRITEMNEELSDHMELLLIERETPLLTNDVLFSHFPEVDTQSFHDLWSLKDHVMKRHFEAAHESMKVNKEFIEESVIDVIGSLRKVFETILEGLDTERVKKRDDPRIEKLYQQTKALLENVDLESFFVMALYEFSKEFVSYVLRDSVAITVQYNLIQMIEANEQYLRLLNNLGLYVQANFTKKRRVFVERDILVIEDMLRKENEHLKNILG